MTESTDAVSGGDTTADYLVNSYITEDGLEVPPPTREMGPRRLTRYRLDAAEFLRALRDQTKLPEEPVEFMGKLPEGAPGSTTEAIYQRYMQLLEEGAFENQEAAQEDAASTEPTEEAEVEEVVSFEQDEVITSDQLADTEPETTDADKEAENDSAPEAAVAVEETTEQEDAHPLVYTAPVDETNTPELSEPAETPVVDEAPVVEEAPAAEPEKPKVTPNRFDLIRAKAAKARAMSANSTDLPSPVSALDSQGLDLENLNRAEDRASVQEESAQSLAGAPAESKQVQAEPEIDTISSESELLASHESTKVEEVETVHAEEAETSTQEPVETPLEAEETEATPVVEIPEVSKDQTHSSFSPESFTSTQVIAAPEQDRNPETGTSSIVNQRFAEDPEPRVEEEKEKPLSLTAAVASSNQQRRDSKPVDEETETKDAEIATPTPLTENKRASSLGVGVMAILVIIVLIVVWLLFFR